ncbi:hypothetical protein HXV84_10970 [Pseudomonas amygdali pv. morsprunorum]|nr:hypothetical protein [Pseudomonas amygdali pv. morsprunorum]
MLRASLDAFLHSPAVPVLHSRVDVYRLLLRYRAVRVWLRAGGSGCALFFIGEIGFNDGLVAWASSMSFVLVTFGMSVICALFQKSLNDLSDLNERLEHEVERRTQERDGIWNVSPT